MVDRQDLGPHRMIGISDDGNGINVCTMWLTHADLDRLKSGQFMRVEFHRCGTVPIEVVIVPAETLADAKAACDAVPDPIGVQKYVETTTPWNIEKVEQLPPLDGPPFKD